MNRKVANCQTGEVKEVPLTSEGQAARDAESADNEPGTGAKWLADQAEQLAKLREQAKAFFADTDNDVSHDAKAMRAFALIVLDEFNALRQWLATFKAEVAVASNLADLKTRIASLPNTPDRTASQLKDAIRDRVDSGDAD